MQVNHLLQNHESLTHTIILKLFRATVYAQDVEKRAIITYAERKLFVVGMTTDAPQRAQVSNRRRRRRRWS